MWTNPKTQQELETALDAGRLYCAMINGTFWLCRRNGRTKTWKTRPGEFRIPYRYGLYRTDQLTNRTVMGYLRIANSRKAAEKERT